MKDIQIAIIGLGYVGLPLAVEFSKKFPVVGYDINQKRVEDLNKGHDFTLEVNNQDLIKVLKSRNDKNPGLFITSARIEISECNLYIITVPTPTDKFNRPVLTPLIRASETVGNYLKKEDIVIYESTVYPGATEEDCVPILEKHSGLIFNKDFYVGYSPERINPGDKEHTVTKIRKVTSGSNPSTAQKVDALYNEIIEAGTFRASTIKIAEAAKVIENAQRDINIAFVNELAKIFDNLNIDTKEVLEAAGTKWNFLPFSPGFVGGHCIGVDPYYLAQKAQETGYNPEIILAGRRMNDGMGPWVASQVVKLLIQKGNIVRDSRILILGITFKENCPDIRNTKVVTLIDELKQYGCHVDVYDPWANKQEVFDEYEILLTDRLETKEDSESDHQKYNAIVLAVSHNEFKNLDINRLKSSEQSVVYDVKSFLDKQLVDKRL